MPRNSHHILACVALAALSLAATVYGPDLTQPTQQALELLRGFGLAPQWHTYPMPHSVCPQEIDDIGAWLRMRLSALPELPA